MSGLRVVIKELKEKGELAVNATVPAADVDAILEGGRLSGPVRVKGAVLEQDDEAAFEGSVRGRWTIECARCLRPVESDFAAAVSARAPIDAGALELTDELRQAIVLAQPMKTYCRPDCKGLCPVCRQDRNERDCGHRPDPAPKAVNRPVDRRRK